jgi:hypothetical protein
MFKYYIFFRLCHSRGKNSSPDKWEFLALLLHKSVKKTYNKGPLEAPGRILIPNYQDGI